MRKVARNYKVGLLVCGSVVLFVGMVLFILGSSLSTELVPYNIKFDESVKGMVVGSKVNFQGIPIGSVADIRFVGGKTQVQIMVDPERAQIQDVTVARMDRLMVTGQVTIELEGYSAEGKPIPIGGLIPPRKSAFDEFAQSLPEVVGNADQLLISLRDLVDRAALVLDETNRGHVQRSLAHVEAVAGTLAKDLPSTLGEIRQTVAAMRPALKTMEHSVAAIGEVARGEDLRQAMKSVRKAADRIDLIQAEVLDLVAEVQSMVGGSRRSFLLALGKVSEALDEVRMLARNLRLAPDSLIFGRSGQKVELPARPQGGK